MKHFYYAYYNPNLGWHVNKVLVSGDGSLVEQGAVLRFLSAPKLAADLARSANLGLREL